MKFVKYLNNEDLVGMLDGICIGFLAYSGIKHSDLVANPELIDNMANSLISVVQFNAQLKAKQQAAMLGVNQDEIVRKVEKNGRVLAVIQGGRE